MKRIGSPHFRQLGRREFFGTWTHCELRRGCIKDEWLLFLSSLPALKALVPEKAPEAKKEETAN